MQCNINQRKIFIIKDNWNILMKPEMNIVNFAFKS